MKITNQLYQSFQFMDTINKQIGCHTVEQMWKAAWSQLNRNWTGRYIIAKQLLNNVRNSNEP